jgi:hypothetical protein
VLLILNTYQPPAGWEKGRQNAGVGTKEGVMFAQTEGNNWWKARVNCNNCGKKGHITWECPEGKRAANKEQLHTNNEDERSDEDNIDQGKKYLCR